MTQTIVVFVLLSVAVMALTDASKSLLIFPLGATDAEKLDELPSKHNRLVEICSKTPARTYPSRPVPAPGKPGKIEVPVLGPAAQGCRAVAYSRALANDSQSWVWLPFKAVSADLRKTLLVFRAQMQPANARTFLSRVSALGLTGSVSFASSQIHPIIQLFKFSHDYLNHSL